MNKIGSSYVAGGCVVKSGNRGVASGDKRQEGQVTKEEITGKLAMVRDTRARDSRDTNNKTVHC